MPYTLRVLQSWSSLPESAKKVGAQSPTKMPNRSECAFASASSPPVKNQMAIEAIIDANPRKKHSVERELSLEVFIYLPIQERVGASTSTQNLG